MIDRLSVFALVGCLFALFSGTTLAAPAPAQVDGLLVDKSAGDLALSWNPVSLDVTGQPLTVDHYRVYRGASPHFPIDFELLDTSPTTGLLDVGAETDGIDYYYLITAVDDTGAEGGVGPSDITEASQLSGFWTPTTIEIDWTAAQPQSEVTAYRIWYGPSKRTYDSFVDVGPTTTSHSLDNLQANTNYHIAVVPIDTQGRSGPMSNEHVDVVNGVLDLRVQDESRLCFGTSNCPAGAGEVQRNSGREIMMPVDFPEGDWTNITVTYTVDSRLCSNVPDKCGDQNPGWNPCGDPWDRTASVYLVLNDCVETGGNCYGQAGNLELIRAVTPFGTDAPPPDGTGVVGPASWTMDVTPFRSLLSGTKHVGTFIGVWVAAGWYVTVDFHFDKDPLNASAKPPADGVVPVWFRDGGNSSTPTQVTIPTTATSVKARLFTTGHGGILDDTCDCLGQGAPCDEFCTKFVNVFVDGARRLGIQPERTDCSPLGQSVCGPGTCQEWNACGCPSCTFDRSGWCPGFIACHTNEPCDQDLGADFWFTPGLTQDVYMDVQGMTSGASWANSLAIYWYE